MIGPTSSVITMRMKLVVVLALVIGSAACNHKKDSSTMPTRDGTMNPTGGSTYGGNAYGGNAYGGAKYGGAR